MNDRAGQEQDGYRALQLMTEIEHGEQISQRELAGRLGIAVGLVNSYLKNFVAKGYVRVKAFPRNRYAYLLTPQGFAEKSRLAYQHINYFTSLYTSTRQEYLELFRRLKAQGVEEVAFCGVDEVAEIAFLSLLEAGMRLTVVVDRDPGRELCGRKVLPLPELAEGCDCPILITTLKRREGLVMDLVALGINENRIYSPGGARKTVAAMKAG